MTRWRQWLASPYFQGLLGLLAGAGTLALALRQVSVAEVAAALSRAELRYVLLALAVTGLNSLAKVARWRVLLNARTGLAQRPSFLYLLGSLLAGQTLNLLYPGRLGDLSRGLAVGRLGPGTVYTLGTVALEKVLDTFSYALLFTWLLVLIPLPAWLQESGLSLVGAAALLVVMTFILACQRARLEPWLLGHLFAWLPVCLREKAVRWLPAAFDSLQTLRRAPDLLRLTGWSLVVWGSAVLTNALILMAFHLRLPVAAPVLVLVILQPGIILPPVPARIGVFQFLCVLALAVFGVQQAVGVSYGVLLHAVVMLPVIASGLLALAVMGWVRPASSPPELLL